MSLINDLLRDLEARQATATTGEGFAGLTPVPRATNVNRRWLAAPVALLLLAGSAGAFWYGETPTTAPEAVAISAGTLFVAAPATASPVIARPANTQATLLGFSNTLSHRPARLMPAAQPGAATVKAATVSPGKQQAALPVVDAATPVEPAAAQPAAIKTIDHRAAGLFALSQGEGAAAEEHFRKVLLSDASDTDAWLNLGFALREQGKSAEAQASLSAALTSAARPALLAQSLARDLIARGADAEALKILQAYRPVSPLDPIHDAYVAAVLQRVGRHDAAADVYRSVLAVRPEAADWWVGLGISEEALGLEHEAIRAYRHARNIGNLDAALARYAVQRIAAIEGKQEI